MQIELFFGVEEAEEEGIHLAAEGRGCLLPQIAIDSQIVGDGDIFSFSDSRIDSLTGVEVSCEKINSNVELGSDLA